MGAGASARNLDLALDDLLDDAAKAVQMLQPNLRQGIMEATRLQDARFELAAATNTLSEHRQVMCKLPGAIYYLEIPLIHTFGLN